MKKLFITLVIMILLVLGAYYFINDDKSTTNKNFKDEYKNVSENNIYVYRSTEEIIKILEKGTGIVFLGFPECPWCQAYAPILDEIARENDIKKIYYCNIKEERANNTDNYKKIVSLLKGNLLFDDEGNDRIYVPDVTIVKNGTIIGHNNETSVVTSEDGTPEEYWTENRINMLKDKLNTYITKIKDTSCHEVCDK